MQRSTDSDTHERLTALLYAQGLAVHDNERALLAAAHASHARDALRLRAGMRWTDEPATIFAPSPSLPQGDADAGV